MGTIKLLLGGSPCTHWSIAQTKNRETKPEGLGWELFRNYLIAREKFRPDYFLYENNKSIAKKIREQITKELGVEPIFINSALVSECKRLQTVPEEYIFPVSDTQASKMLGNGWTVDVIAHILHYAQEITTEPLEVLSMYDGMSCGRLALEKLGAHVERYYATEIDKYAIKTTQANFPDTVQLGDAFGVRDDGWAVTG